MYLGSVCIDVTFPINIWILNKISMMPLLALHIGWSRPSILSNRTLDTSQNFDSLHVLEFFFKFSKFSNLIMINLSLHSELIRLYVYLREKEILLPTWLIQQAWIYFLFHFGQLSNYIIQQLGAYDLEKFAWGPQANCTITGVSTWRHESP